MNNSSIRRSILTVFGGGLVLPLVHKPILFEREQETYVVRTLVTVKEVKFR